VTDAALHTIFEVGIALAASLVGFGFANAIARFRAWRELKRGAFLDQVNLSLNIMVGEDLKLRTISERPLAEIVANSEARTAVRRAAKAVLNSKKTFRSEEEDIRPLLRLPKDQAPYILRCVVNHVAGHFSAGSLRQDAGHPVSPTWYAVCLTSEETDQGQTKIRALLLKEKHLKDFPLLKGDGVTLEHPNHMERVRALHRAANLYTGKKHAHLFDRIEISL
jgi:hypothetical protein